MSSLQWLHMRHPGTSPLAGLRVRTLFLSGSGPEGRAQ